MRKIGVDAMGGDFAPEAVVSGAVLALNAVDHDTRIVLFGDENKIVELLEKEGVDRSNFDIVATTEVIGMNEHPTQAFSKKPNSSIVVGFGYLKNKLIDAFASSGSTGAMMVGSMYAIKQIEGVIRPTIATMIPNCKGGFTLLLDVGLNVDCKPDVLAQYGHIGSIFARSVMGIKKPRVALLNIGEEREKGNLASRAANELMSDGADYNFIGNVEGNQIYTGDADVIVCDGFVGNVVLKQTEGLFNVCNQLGISHPFIEKMNYETVGGTPVLGINSTVVIGHGCSSPLAIKNMILQTERCLKASLVEKLKESFC
jgi:glycerol-3-phosphate acyltransferase PlsX